MRFFADETVRHLRDEEELLFPSVLESEGRKLGELLEETTDGWPCGFCDSTVSVALPP